MKSQSPTATWRPDGSGGRTDLAPDGGLRAGFGHVAGADSYRIEARAPDGAVASAVVYKDDHADVTGLVNGTPYRVRVVAVSAAGETASPWAALTPRQAYGALPPGPQALIPVKGGVVFEYRGAAADDGYAIEVTDAAGRPLRSRRTGNRGFSRIEDLPAGEPVRVRVRAVRGGTQTAASEWTEATPS